MIPLRSPDLDVIALFVGLTMFLPNSYGDGDGDSTGGYKGLWLLYPSHPSPL